MTAIELKPCPFCGSSSIDPAGWKSADSSGPVCDGCGASAESVESWNTRAESAPLAAAVQAEREAFRTMIRQAKTGGFYCGGGDYGQGANHLRSELLAELDSRPAPAVDVIGLISEFIEADDAWRNDDDALTEEYQRMKRAYDALCALVARVRRSR